MVLEAMKFILLISVGIRSEPPVFMCFSMVFYLLPSSLSVDRDNVKSNAFGKLYHSLTPEEHTKF